MEKATKNRVLEKLHYKQETGEFYKITGPKTARNISQKLAGCLDKDGYRVITIDYSEHRGHQLVWLLETGAYSEKILDHKDGNPANNRIDNLRETDHQGNSQNRQGPNKGKFGGLPIGVYPRGDRFYAEIRVNKKPVKLGTFATVAEAENAHLIARRKHYLNSNL